MTTFAEMSNKLIAISMCNVSQAFIFKTMRDIMTLSSKLN